MTSTFGCCGSQCLRASRPQPCCQARLATPAMRAVRVQTHPMQQMSLHRQRLHLQPLRSSASSDAQHSNRVVEAPPEQPEDAVEPAGPELTTVMLRKPVGIVFAQNKGGPVFVEELTPGGAAEQSGAVAVGDVLVSCSAVMLKAGKEGEYEKRGHGARPYDNFERVEFNCEGLDFKTVMNALKSNNERWGFRDVTMTFRPGQ